LAYKLLATRSVYKLWLIYNKVQKGVFVFFVPKSLIPPLKAQGSEMSGRMVNVLSVSVFNKTNLTPFNPTVLTDYHRLYIYLRSIIVTTNVYNALSDQLFILTIANTTFRHTYLFRIYLFNLSEGEEFFGVI